MVRMVVVMNPMVSGMIVVVRMRLGAMRMFMRVLMLVFVGMLVTVLMSVFRTVVGVLVRMLVAVFMGMFVFMFVLSFHRQSPLKRSGSAHHEPFPKA